MFIGMGRVLTVPPFSGSVMLTTHGRPSFSADAGEWLHYARPIWNDTALSVLLTTSGESAELVELMKDVDDRSLGLICNNPASTCWNMTRNRLPILAGPEYGNATKLTPIPPPSPSSSRPRCSSFRGRTKPNAQPKYSRPLSIRFLRYAASSSHFAVVPPILKSSGEAPRTVPPS